jgi:hypothetical protein
VERRDESGQVVGRTSTLVGVCAEELPELLLQDPETGATPGVLHVSMDMGPVGFSAAMFLSQRGLRVTFQFDLLHRVVSDLAEGISDCGLGLLRAQCAVACRVHKGPFSPGGAQHHALREAAEDYFSKRDPSCDLWQCLYPELAVAARVRETHPDVWSDAAVQATWDWARRAMLNAEEGANTRLARWFSFEETSRAALAVWPATLLCLVWLGWTKGWWKTPEQSPLLKLVGQAPAVAEAEPLPGDAEQPEEEEEEQEEPAAEEEGLGERVNKGKGRALVAAERKRWSNTLAYATRLLARPLHMALWRAMVEIVSPMEIWHKWLRQQLATVEGTGHAFRDLVSRQELLTPTVGLLRHFLSYEYYKACAGAGWKTYHARGRGSASGKPFAKRGLLG